MRKKANDFGHLYSLMVGVLSPWKMVALFALQIIETFVSKVDLYIFLSNQQLLFREKFTLIVHR